MRIVSSKRINFLVSNIFEKYYEPVQAELSNSGLTEDTVYKIKQEILGAIYRKAMDEGVETEEGLDEIASDVINEQLESVLVPYYAQKYVDRFSLDKMVIENGMLNRVKDNKDNKDNKEVRKTERETSKIEIEAEIRAEMVKNIEKMKTEIQAELTNNTEAVKTEVETEMMRNTEVRTEVETEMAKNMEVRTEVEAEITKNTEVRTDIGNETTESITAERTDEQREVLVTRKMEEPKIRRFRINWVLTIFASLLLTAALWFVVGILMGNGYLTKVDLGYTWFNSHIWSVF